MGTRGNMRNKVCGVFDFIDKMLNQEQKGQIYIISLLRLKFYIFRSVC